VDNTFFTSITTSITGVTDMALVAVVSIAAIVLGATVGYRLYKRFLAG